MFKRSFPAWLALGFSLLAPGAILAEGASPLPEPARVQTPEERAIEHYNQGLAERDAAWRLQRKLARGGLSDDGRAKIEEKVQKAYARAIDAFEAAVGLNPRMHQAYGSLGYAHRQLGDYERALAAYDKALELSPRYAEAMEYRGEAYLGLNRVDAAKQAYLSLLEDNREMAGELRGAMRSWLEQRRREPDGVKFATLDGFERWLDAHSGEGAPPVPQTPGKVRSW